MESPGDIIEAERSDEDLFADYLAGDHACMPPLIDRYQRMLYAMLIRQLGDRQLAEDALQNTWIKICRRPGTFQPGAKFRPWLYSVAAHAAIDMQRQIARRPTVSIHDEHEDGEEDAPDSASLEHLLEAGQEDPLDAVIYDNESEILRQAVARLPEKLRITMRMAYYQRLKYRTIAELTNVSIGTVKSRLHAAIVKLREDSEVLVLQPS